MNPASRRFKEIKSELSERYSVLITDCISLKLTDNNGWYNGSQIHIWGPDPKVLTLVMLHEVGHRIAHLKGCKAHKFIFEDLDLYDSVFDLNFTKSKIIVKAEEAAWECAISLAIEYNLYNDQFKQLRDNNLEWYRTWSLNKRRARK